MDRLTIHADFGIEWHRRRVDDFAHGLMNLGIGVTLTDRRTRINHGPVVLFGTNLWRHIEEQPGDWLLVDRASFRDPDYVTLGWNGRGRTADYRVPENHDASRWETLGVDLLPQRGPGDAVIVCGEWDGSHPKVYGATHFRPHPAGSNPTDLPTVRDWIDGTYHVLRSSVAVEARVRGYVTVVYDPTSLAFMPFESRRQWAHWLACTQWSWDEIRQGEPIGHLFR